VLASIAPVEAFVGRDHAYPDPLPPVAVKATVPLGAIEAVAGVAVRIGGAHVGMGADAGREDTPVVPISMR